MSTSEYLEKSGVSRVSILGALAGMGINPLQSGAGGGAPKKQSYVIGTVHIGNDKERVYKFRQKMTPKQVKAIRKATGGNRTTHVLMRANSQFG